MNRRHASKQRQGNARRVENGGGQGTRRPTALSRHNRIFRARRPASMPNPHQPQA